MFTGVDKKVLANQNDNLFIDEIFVFSPNGDLINLPKSANCIDFAFEIHTDIGLKCIGVKVNGKLVSLSHKLSSGDQVEVITSNKKRATNDWLRFVVTSRAKSKIKSAPLQPLSYIFNWLGSFQYAVL